MTRTLDIESLVEDAFVEQLPVFLDNGVTVKHWEDIREKGLTEYILISAASVDQEQGTFNCFIGQSVLVTIACFTGKRIDETGRAANALRGAVRQFLNQSDVVATLNTTTGLSVYNNGVIPQGSTNTEDERMWQKNLTILVVATTV